MSFFSIAPSAELTNYFMTLHPFYKGSALRVQDFQTSIACMSMTPLQILGDLRTWKGAPSSPGSQTFRGRE